MKSIITNDKKCYFCDSTDNIHFHHVFRGKNRQTSERYGLKVPLCAGHHNINNYSVHNNKGLNLLLCEEIQRKAMEHYGWSITKFIELFGRNYI